MKKSLPIILCSIITVGGIAQNKLVPFSGAAKLPAVIANQSASVNKNTITDSFDKFTAPLNSSIGSGTNGGMNTLADAVFLGNTKYQLQSNSSTRNALVTNSDGTMAAVWTMSRTTTPFADRGTGYVYFDGTAWSGVPSNRIETGRTGWPSIVHTGTGKEIIISHNNTAEELQLTTRNTKGSGAWTQNTTKLAGPQTEGCLWPRIAVGGTNNASLHAIYVNAPLNTDAGTGYLYNNQDPALLYARSQDEGATWDKIHEIHPEHDSLAGFNGFGGDSYAIDARGNTVAYCSGSLTSDWFIMKSNDNGATWNKTTVLDFPINNYSGQITDINNDQIGDTIEVSDGNYAILIDNNDKVHVFSGLTRILGTTDTSYVYFPGTSGMMYWNETMGNTPPVVIAGLVEINGTAGFNLPAGQFPWGEFGACSLTTHPSAGIDAAGTIYLAFDALVDGSADPFGKALRNIFVTQSSDGGATWSAAIRPTGANGDGVEQVFPSATRNVSNSCFGLIFQQDNVAGHGVQGNATTISPDVTNNAGEDAEMYYVCVPQAEILSINNKDSKNASISQNYPNPFTGVTNIDITLAENTNVSIDVYNLMGQKALATVNKNLAAGKTNVDLNCASLKAGMYFYTVTVGNERLTKRMIIK